MKLFAYSIRGNYQESMAKFEIRDFRTLAPIVAISGQYGLGFLLFMEDSVLISRYKLTGYLYFDGFPAFFCVLMLLSIVLEAPFNNLDI